MRVGDAAVMPLHRRPAFPYVPEAGVHGVRNASREPASMPLLFTPGATREGGFEGLAHLGGRSEADRRACFECHDAYWTDD